MLWKCCTQYASKLSSGHRTGKGQFSFQFQRKAMPKNAQTTALTAFKLIALISHTSKVMLKILQARLQQYVNRVLPDVQAGFRKGRGTRDQIANIWWWVKEKVREFQKITYFCFITMLKAYDCVDHNKLWEILKEMGIPDHLTCLLRTCIQVKKQQLELDREQTGSKSGKEYVKAVYCNPPYLIYMWSTSCEMLGWMKHNLESR